MGCMVPKDESDISRQMKWTWRVVGLLDCFHVVLWFRMCDQFIKSELQAVFVIWNSRCLELLNDTATQEWPACNTAGTCSTCAYNLWIMKTERIFQFLRSLFFWDIGPPQWNSGSDVSRQRIGLISRVELPKKNLSWTFQLWRWDNYVVSKRWVPVAQRHGVMLQEPSGILRRLWKTKYDCYFGPLTILNQERVLVGINAKVNFFESHYRKENN
jgi:hypothetical protein